MNDQPRNPARKVQSLNRALLTIGLLLTIASVFLLWKEFSVSTMDDWFLTGTAGLGVLAIGAGLRRDPKRS